MERKWIPTLMILFAIAGEVRGQETIKGRVFSMQDGTPMPGVNVNVKGTKVGTVTDGDGRYCITVPKGKKILAFSFIGFLPREINIGEQGVVNADLSVDVKALEEEVITCRRAQRRSTSCFPYSKSTSW